MPEWPRRGLEGAAEGAECLIRADQFEDDMEGFFVAVFVRDERSIGKEARAARRRARRRDRWRNAAEERDKEREAAEKRGAGGPAAVLKKVEEEGAGDLRAVPVRNPHATALPVNTGTAAPRGALLASGRRIDSTLPSSLRFGPVFEKKNGSDMTAGRFRVTFQFLGAAVSPHIRPSRPRAGHDISRDGGRLAMDTDGDKDPQRPLLATREAAILAALPRHWEEACEPFELGPFLGNLPKSSWSRVASPNTRTSRVRSSTTRAGTWRPRGVVLSTPPSTTVEVRRWAPTAASRVSTRWSRSSSAKATATS